MDRPVKRPPDLRELARELIVPSESFERYIPRKAPGAAPAGLDLLGQLGELARESLAPAPVTPSAPGVKAEKKPEPKPQTPPVQYASERVEYQKALSRDTSQDLASALLDFHRRTQPAAYRMRPTLAANPKGEVAPAEPASTFSTTSIPAVEAVPKQQPLSRSSTSRAARGNPILRSRPPGPSRQD